MTKEVVMVNNPPAPVQAFDHETVTPYLFISHHAHLQERISRRATESIAPKINE